MKWLQRRHYFERECARYTVDFVPMRGSATGWRFTAWRRALDRGVPTNLGCFDSRRDAINACAADLRSSSAVRAA